jgi:hypothetical protein
LAYDYKQGYPEKPSFTTKASMDDGKTTNESTEGASAVNDSASSAKASSTSK